jgi:hypothetical protein
MRQPELLVVSNFQYSDNRSFARMALNPVPPHQWARSLALSMDVGFRLITASATPRRPREIGIEELQAIKRYR